MLVYKNFLSEDVIKALKEDVTMRVEAGAFIPDNNFWPVELTKNIPGVVSISPVSEDIKAIVLDTFTKATKYHNISHSRKILCMHYFWHPLSGINMHDDGSYNFGATIYLNNEWDIHYGGLLLEVDKPNKDITVHLPEYNKCIINVGRQWHMVTPTAFHAPVRHTIQIFGVKNET